MSWISENYEKAALGASVVVALGIGASILTGGNEVDVEVRDPAAVNEYEVAESASLTSLSEELVSPQGWDPIPHNGSDLTSFVGFPLYAIKGQDGIEEIKPETNFDGIPLLWWREHKLNDYQYPNAGGKDADKDGFTNKEEFVAKTSPVDVEDHPDFIEKLKFVKVLKSKPFKIQWARLDDNRGSFTFRSGRNRSSLDLAGVGDTIPKEPRDEAFKNRFKIVGKGEGVNPANETKENFYLLEDLSPLKSGVQYKLWYSDRNVYYDRSGLFKLDTPNGGEPFIVEEGAEFSLPFKEGGKGYRLPLQEKKGRDFGVPTIEVTVDGVKKLVPLGLAPVKEPVNNDNI